MADVILSPTCRCGVPQRGHVLEVVGPVLATRRGLERVPWLNSNDRGHWTKHEENIAAWKGAGRAVAEAVLAAGLLEPLGKTEVWAYVRRRRRDDNWDPANWYPNAKAAIDGMVAAGLWPDDNVRYVDGPFMRPGIPLPSAKAPAPVGSLLLHLIPLGGALWPDRMRRSSAPSGTSPRRSERCPPDRSAPSSCC